MSAYSAPTILPSFNPINFSSSTTLTQTSGDKRYVKLTGGAMTGSLSTTGSLSFGSLSSTVLTQAAQINVAGAGNNTVLISNGTIPTWVRKIVIDFKNLVQPSTNDMYLQWYDGSWGPSATYSYTYGASSTTGRYNSAGILVNYIATTSSQTYSGRFILDYDGNNTWLISYDGTMFLTNAYTPICAVCPATISGGGYSTGFRIAMANQNYTSGLFTIYYM